MRSSLLVVCLLAACVQPSAPAGDDKPTTETPPEAAALDGRAWVAVDGVGLHVLDDRGWRLLLEVRAPIRDILMLDGKLHIVSAFGVQRVDENGQVETVDEIDRDISSQTDEPVAPQLPSEIAVPEGWSEQPLRSVTTDAGGRVWVGTHNGLIIIEADGQFSEYPIGQLGDIAGPVGPILVEGNGPAPPALGRVRKGGLTGVIVTLDGEDKRPLPNARLDVCSRRSPGDDPERSPCDGAEETHTTTTNGDGQFEFSNLPIDHYWFGVEIDGRWARGQPKALNMRAGMSGNVGKIAVAIPE